MNLRKRKNKINYGAEGLPPVRRFVQFLEKKLSFILYYAIIIAVLFTIFFTGWRRIAYINGNGIIVKTQVRVRADRDLYVNELKKSVGDTVSADDTLVGWQGAHSKVYRSNQTGSKSLDRKLVTLKISIGEKKAKLREFAQIRVDIQKRLKKSKKQVALEVKPDEKIVTLTNLLNENSRRYSRVKSEIEALEESIDEVVHMLNVSESEKDSLKSVEIVDLGVYTSRWSGEIHDCFVQEGEYVKEGEEIMKISTCTKPHIAAFFKMKHYEIVTVGKNVQIVLPNNKAINGTIVKVFKATEHLPSEFKKSYDISRPRIYTHIETDTEIPCTYYDGMTVRVLLERELPWN